MPLEIGSNNLKTPDTVIDKIMDYLAVCRLTLERGHQSHLFCHQASVSISSRIILSVALEIPSRSEGTEREPGPPLLFPGFPAIFAPAVAKAKVYIVTFRTYNDDRPSKFIVLANNMKSAINMAWEHGGADFQSRFDKSTAQAQEMKDGALRVL